MTSKKGDFFSGFFETVSKELTSVGKNVTNLFDKGEVGTKVPAINIVETGEGFIMEVAAPGMAKEDFSLGIEEGALVVKSKGQAEDTRKFIHREFFYGPFQRKFQVPETVDIEQITAAYKEGVLLVTLPKKDEFQQKSSEIKIW